MLWRELHTPCKVSIYAFSWALFPPRFQAQRHQVKNPLARQRQTPGIIQRPLAIIHKRLGTPAVVVCGGGPLHRVESPETSERCRTVCAPCDNTLLEEERQSGVGSCRNSLAAMPRMGSGAEAEGASGVAAKADTPGEVRSSWIPGGPFPSELCRPFLPHDTAVLSRCCHTNHIGSAVHAPHARRAVRHAVQNFLGQQPPKPEFLVFLQKLPILGGGVSRIPVVARM